MSKQNKIYLVVLLVLVIIFAITKMNNNVEKRIKFFDVDSISIASLEIADLQDTIRIAKQNDSWQIIDPIQYPTDETKINNFFERVIKVKTSSLPIAEEESSFEKYELTDSLATELTLFDENDQILDRSLIGKSQDYNNTPARKKGKNKIFRLESNISYLVKAELSNWRKKIVAEFEEADIAKINIDSEQNDYSISFADTTWQYKSGKEQFKIDNENENLRRIFSGLKRINSTKFIDNEFEKYEEELKSPQATISVEKFDGSTMIFKLIPHEEEKKFILQKNDETKTLYIVYQSWLDRYLKEAEDFQKE